MAALTARWNDPCLLVASISSATQPHDESAGLRKLPFKFHRACRGSAIAHGYERRID
jgi:hypothetical protein